MVADVFEAFRNWPRRARYGVIWVGIIALLGAAAQREPSNVVGKPTVQWLKLEPIATSAATTASRSRVHP